MRHQTLRPLHLLAAAALLALGSLATADQAMLKFIPVDSQIVGSFDFEAINAEPQLATMLQQLTEQMRVQQGIANLPALNDLKGVAFGLYFDEVSPDEPRVFAAIQTSKDFSMLPEIATAQGLRAEQIQGRTVYHDMDTAFMIAPSNDIVLISDTPDRLGAMVAAFDAGGVATRGDVKPAAGPVNNPVGYFHVDQLETLTPQMVGIKMQAQGIAMMAMGQVPPEMQASMQQVVQIIPHIFEANDWDIYAGFDATNLVTHVEGQMASAEAASATSSALDGAMKAAAAQEPEAQKFAQRSRFGATGQVFQFDTTQPKEEVMGGLQMALGMAMMQAGGGQPGMGMGMEVEQTY